MKDPLEKILESSAAFSSISELGPAFFSMLIVFALMYWGTMARIVRWDGEFKLEPRYEMDLVRVDLCAEYCGAVFDNCRITSYNVCYTKLLRQLEDAI